MSKLPADDFFTNIDYPSIIDTVKGIYTSDASINTLLDFERVLDEADLYAYKNWGLGELVDGPDSKRYSVSCIFMYPEKLMPDPRGGKRLINLGCTIQFKKTGSNIDNSSAQIQLENNSQTSISYNFAYPFTAGEYVELWYHTSTANTSFPYSAAGSGFPATPSIVLTVTQIA